MRKIIILLILSLFYDSGVMAGTVEDADGILGAAWSPPTTGNVPTTYVLSYNINGILDSVSLETANVKDSSVVLSNSGDWAILEISSIYEYWSEYLQQTVREQSTSVFSDTVTFSGTVSVNPPTGVHWE